MGTKKKKSRAQKTAIGQSSIPAPLPHSTVNYSKFDNIGDSDDDEEKKGSADHPWCGPEGCNCPSCRSIRGFSVNSDGESVSDDEEDIVPITPKKGKHEATSDSTGSAASQQTEAKAQKPTEKAKKQGLQAGFFAAQTGNKHSSDAGSKLKQKQKQGALSTSQSVKTPSSMRGSASDDDDDGSLPSLVTDDDDFDEDDEGSEDEGSCSTSHYTYTDEEEDAQTFAADSSQQSKTEADNTARKLESQQQMEAAKDAILSDVPFKTDALAKKGMCFEAFAEDMGMDLSSMAPFTRQNLHHMFQNFLNNASFETFIKTMPALQPQGPGKNPYAKATEADFSRDINEAINKVTEATHKPYPGLQSHEEPVERYAFSLANKSFTEQMAEKLRSTTPMIFEVVDVDKEEAALKAGNPHNTKKQSPAARPVAESAPAESSKANSQKGATAASPAEQAERSLKMSAAEATAKARRMEENMEALATQAGRVIGDIDSTIDLNLETASKRADDNFKRLLEEEEKQKEKEANEKKKQEDRDEAKRSKRKQKQQRKKERTKGGHSQADDEASTSRPQETEMHAEELAKEAKCKQQLLAEANAASTAKAADNKAKLKGKNMVAEPQKPIPPTSQDNRAGKQASIANALPTDDKRFIREISQRPAESSSRGIDEVSVESADEAEDIISNRDADYDEGEDSSNPFSILLKAQKAAADKKQAGASKATAQQNVAREVRKKLAPATQAAEPSVREEPAQEASRRNEIGPEWRRQPFPNPSGYAPGNLVAQAKAVWKGLEDNIDAADPDPLSEAVARTEEWLTTYTRSKVFAVFNAETKIRAEQARQILRSRHGVHELPQLVRPSPSQGTNSSFVPRPTPQRPTPQFTAPYRPQMGGRGFGRQPPYSGRGRGPPPAFANSAPPPRPVQQQWESTNVADLDPFGGVPNRSARPFHPHASVQRPPANLDFEAAPPGISGAAPPSRGQQYRPPMGRVAKPVPVIPVKPAPRQAMPSTSVNALQPESRPAFSPAPATATKVRQLEEEEETVCCICLEWPPEIILQPCGHNNMCEKCAHNVKNLNEGLCPECRCKIEAIIRPR